MPEIQARLIDYWERSRSHTYSLLLALPLLLGYELLIGLSNRLRGEGMEVRNLAEMLMLRMIVQLGIGGQAVFIGLLILAALLVIAREWRRNPSWSWRALEPRILGWMLLESAIWAWLFLLLVSSATGYLLSPLAAAEAAGTLASAASPGGAAPAAAPAAGTALQGLALSLGAGLYEELFFRVLLVSGIAWLLTAGGLARRGPALLAAVLASALLFSLAHYVGPLGDPLQLGSFTFRFLGGLVFSAIYALRGFGIVTWTHALYDIYIYLIG